MPTGAQILHTLGINFTQRVEDLERGVTERHLNTASCVIGFGAQFSDFFFSLRSVCKLGDPVVRSQPENLWPAEEKRLFWGFTLEYNSCYNECLKIIRKKELYLTWHTVMCTNFIICELLYLQENTSNKC